MSSRTECFFEQDHTNKQSRPAQWHRPNNRVPLGETSINTSGSNPSVSATSRSKAKLKAFQFVPGAPEDSVEIHNGGERHERETGDQETESRHGETSMPEATASAPLDVNQAADVAHAVDAANRTPQLPHAHTFPSTPGTRLPLDVLIANLDENARRPEPKEQSPEEYVGWIPNSSSTLLTPNRRRKRARSSSPSCPTTSSQRQDAATFFAGDDVQAEDRTPEADPAIELWQRYATNKSNKDIFKLPELSNLIFQASPRPFETPGKSGRLRRWASTGNDWPSSKSKRRKTDAKASISVWQEHKEVDTCGKSKVAAMVERLQESLASQKLAQATSKPADAMEGPSSSSPLPETGLEQSSQLPPASPLQPRQRVEPPIADTLPVANSTVGNQPNRASTVDGPISPTRLPHAHIADSIVSAPLHLKSKAPLPGYKRPSISRSASSCGRQYPTKQTALQPAPVLPAVVEDLDEFGDAFDLSVEDLEELVSQVPLDRRPLHEIPQHPDPPPQQIIVLDDEDIYHDDSDQHTHTVADNDKANHDLHNDDDDDEFGGGDIDEDSFAQAELSATQALRASYPSSNMQHISPRKRNPRKSKNSQRSSDQFMSHAPHESGSATKRLLRFTVKQAVEGEYANAKGRRCPERLLLAESEHAARPTAITLRDSWAMTSVSTGNIVHVAFLAPSAQALIPPGTPAGQIMITDEDNSPFIIVHPDHMLSATTVADSFDCIRKAVLQDRIKATGDTNKPMVYGKILHEIFQQALTANRWDSTYLTELVEKTTQNHLEGLWELGMTDTVLAVEEITAKMGELSAWARAFVAAEPSNESVVDDKQGEKIWMSVSKLIAIEEHIWSPMFGLKGNIDATIQATVIDHPEQPAKKLIAPFEVKTGRTTQSPAHRAQTALYTLLLSDRYDVAVNAGILYYLESSTTSRISPPLFEIRQMIQQRNRLAAYIHRARHPRKEKDVLGSPTVHTQDVEDSGLPSVLKNPYKCSRCYAQLSCFTYHALAENGTTESAGLIDDGKKDHSLVWHEAIGHLALTAKNSVDAEKSKVWFDKWDKLLTYEESELSRFRRELWTMPSAEREAVGRCFGGLVIAQDVTSATPAVRDDIVDGIEGGGGKINRFAYVFKRHEPTRSSWSFAEGSQLTMGEPVVVSSEDGQWALANGYVTAVTKLTITVAVDRKLEDARQKLVGFDEIRNQSFRGIMSVGHDVDLSNIDSVPLLYRLDKDEFSNGLALVRNNLVSMMSSHPINTKLRHQVILGGAPSFALSADLPSMQASQLGEMNEDQRAAVGKVLSAQDYALILGMPGTGKTTTIAHIIRALLAEDKSILLTSFTHTAVDNILLKIRDVAPPNSILRLGVQAKVNAEVQTFCQLAADRRGSIDDIEKAYMGCRIVATTCMGTNHSLFNRRAFDVCIVDEASQITLPTSLGPLLHARKFVLVGDHYQLPPLVQNRTALEGGLDVSLFRQLSEEHPTAVAALSRQYRMCEEVMTLSNILIYQGQLRCGNDGVANRTLSLPAIDSLPAYLKCSIRGSCCKQCWIKEAVQSERKVVFANTDSLGRTAMETLTSGKNITNEVEATLSAQLVLSLLQSGVSGRDIGVITLYRSQLALMRHLFRLAGIGTDVEIDSADRFQGRDKECIILSMVRSNEAGVVGELLKDWRRVNVAFTRARSKLIVLGSRRTLVNNDLLASFLALVEEKRWILDLPPDAESCHAFNFSSQSAASLVAKDSPVSNRKSRSSPGKVARDTNAQMVLAASPSKVLKPSFSAGNRSPIKRTSMKAPTKVFKGLSMAGSRKAREMKEQIAVEIFEDLTADDL